MKKKIFSTLLMGAFFLASMSMFTSCKDYDDDINKNADAIAALQTQLSALEKFKSDYESTLSSLASTYATKAEVALKADKSELDSYATKEALGILDAYVKALYTNAKIDELIGEVKSALDKKLDKEGLEDLKTKIAAYDEALNKLGDIDKLNEAVKAASENIEAQEEINKGVAEKLKELDKLGGFETRIKKLEDLTSDLEDVKKAVEAATDLDAVKKLMEEANKKVDEKISKEINALQFLIEKQLASIMLRPQFYWEGLAGIEVPMIWQNDVYGFDKDAKEMGEIITVNERTQEEVATPFTIYERAGFLSTDGKSYSYPEWENANGVSNPGKTLDETKKINISNGGIAEYHLNPATANLDGTTLSFFTNYRNHYTRAIDESKPFAWAKEKDGSKNTVENGILKVPFKVDENVLAELYINYFDPDKKVNTTYPHSPADPHTSYIVPSNVDDEYSIAFRDTLPFIALQIEKARGTENDLTITSDYAVVTPAKYENLVIADHAADYDFSGQQFDPAPTGRHSQPVVDEVAGKFVSAGGNHIYRKATDAVIANATHPILYTEEFDVREWVETHFDYVTTARYGESKFDQVMTEATMEALGLHYEFFAVDYTKGQNKTSETAHIKKSSSDPKDGKFKPVAVDDNGNQVPDEEVRRQIIDREPLIRVNLVDEDGNVVEYGYIKVRIVDALPKTLEVNLDLSDYWMNCGDEGRITWSQVEYLILKELSAKGLTKEEFENQYYFESNWGNKNRKMPTGKEIYYGKAGANTARYGVRYYKVGNEYKEWSTLSADDLKAAAEAGYTNLGRVWYTPHDNPATDFDPETNVVVWSMYGRTEVVSSDNTSAGFMENADFQKLIELCGASYESEGLSTKAVKTTVRFKKIGAKNDDSNSIYLTLTIPVGKIHWEYANVANKDLHHWFKFNSGLPGDQSDIDVHQNVPTPAQVSNRDLNVYDFTKNVREFWNTSKPLLNLQGRTDKFYKFYESKSNAGKSAESVEDIKTDAAGNLVPLTQVTFQFTLPKKGVNSTIDADGGRWKVHGISGTEWTLERGDNNMTIYAVEKNGAAIEPDTVCTFLDNDGNPTDVLRYMGLAKAGAENLHPAATDLVNKSGRYDNKGYDGKAENHQRFTKSDDKQYLTKAAFLEENIDETFTAYVECVFSEEPCYVPLNGDNLFNVRFIRPINVLPLEKTWTDALNRVEFVEISDLVKIIDWRDYDVKPNGTFKEGEVPYSFYGVSDLAVIRDEIRSDAMEEYNVRIAAAKTNEADIKKYPTINAIGSLTGLSGERYLQVWAGDATAISATETDPAKIKSGTEITGTAYSWGQNFKTMGRITYTNNDGVAQIFHIYVPIAVKYNWGNIKQDKDLDPTPEKLDNNYTQTVWAVITVKSTTGSASAKKN